MESVKIVLLCIAAAILYGIVHDQFTARVCIEYFTIFHPPVFATQSATLLGLGWGVIATWWMGAFLGFLLALAARAGSRAPIPTEKLLKPIGKLLLLMGVSAVISGLAGFTLAKAGMISPPVWVVSVLASSRYARFMADWWAHGASYAVGFFGGISLCIVQYRSRKINAKPA